MSDGLWRDIKTAPKDGTKVILYWWPERDGICVGWYEKRTAKTHLTPWRRDLFGLSDTVWGMEPTHWMPLPAAPSEPTKEGG